MRLGDWLYVPGIRKALQEGAETITGYVNGEPLQLYMKGLTKDEIQILLDGCLMNYYRNNRR